MPAGHPEGYLEGFAQIYANAADLIAAHRAKGGVVIAAADAAMALNVVTVDPDGDTNIALTDTDLVRAAEHIALAFDEGGADDLVR